MEIGGQTESGANGGGGGGFRAARCWELLRWAAGVLRGKAVGLAGRLGRIARDEPRRVAHSVKVGLALTLVSVLYYVRPLFNSWGASTMWAVLTVVVVMEYTVGGTLCKGLNRASGTLVAGFIAVGAHKVAYMCGDKAEPVLLAIFVFLLSSAATFSRFIPEVKARYDYGVTIFILTFSLVAVSSYRVDELIRLAHRRFSTIAVGVATCLCTTIFVFPVWAGEGLHKLAIANLNKLAEFLEGIESECFRENATFENLEAKPFLQVYQSVLNSKATEDSLCNFAKWEPCHGKFKLRHPWSQYQKLGALCRECASSMEALSSYVVTLARTEVRTACRQMSLHSAKALRELTAAMRTMTTVPSPASVHVSAAIKAAKGLRDGLSEGADLARAMHVAVIASLLSELVTKTKQITESVDVLARLARFRNPETTQTHKGVAIDVVS
ncbi:Aluminum-activated malate transporter 8 [Zea mays]|uniref:Aluminum-activated malate transporter 8 n=1 Tax=Zea mays TaxID=4577 RepID=A0A1D6J6S6_MAIZE|nr:Aluminum-activated malate transporter 8 [Zea mays]